MDMGDLSERGRMEADPLKGQRVLKIGGVGKTASEPVNRLADDDVELAFSGVRDQLLESGPEPARAADRRVPVSPTIVQPCASA